MTTAPNLLSTRYNHTSQFGEDGILQAIFSRIGPGSRWCVECGAADGIGMSNTLRLRDQDGWSAVMIEGVEKDFAELQAHCGERPNHWLIQEMVSEEHPLDEVLAHTSIPQQFDLLSLDIDGNEYTIWSQMVKYRARVVVVEFNPSFGPFVFFVQNPKAQTIRSSIGSALQSIAQLGDSLGYELVCVTDVNCIFVDKREFPLLNLPTRTPLEQFFELWPNGDCPWMPVVVSDYSGNHYLVRAGGWNQGECREFLLGKDLEQLREQSPALPKPNW